MAEYGPKPEILNAAAMHIIDARKEAATMLRRAGVELPDTGGFTSACTGITAPGVRCGCDEYTGDGGECRTRFGGSQRRGFRHRTGTRGVQPSSVRALLR